MKLLRVGPAGQERPAVLDDQGVLRDLSEVTPDIDGRFLAGDGPQRVREALAGGRLSVVDGTPRVGAPVRVGKIVCIGLNYRDHAEETGGWIPDEPVVFLKPNDTVVGANDDLLLPRGSTKTDWEVELAVVIGRTARYLSAEVDPLAYVAGYAISNDVSEREFQLERGGQWDKGKACETFNPFGPWLVTADEIDDPQALDLRLWVDGTLRQNGNTKNMIAGIADVVRYVSQFMVLYPGDVINTGTPAGVALGQPDPKPYLREGSVVEVEIEGLGRQRQDVRRA